MESQGTSKLVSRFLAEPDRFYGTANENPLTWFRQVDRLRRGAGLSDEEILIVVGSHMRGQAESWWVTIEEDIHTWLQFKQAFWDRYIRRINKELWWKEIEKLHQTKDQTVEDIAYRLEELFQLVGPLDDAIKLRYFYKAINPVVAYEVEKNETPSCWKDAVVEAAKVESIRRKYQDPDVIHLTSTAQSNESATPLGTGTSISPNDSISNALSELAEGFKALKIHLIEQSKSKKALICYECGVEGHTKPRCPKLKESQGKEVGRQ